jgi:hypothetical protein
LQLVVVSGKRTTLEVKMSPNELSNFFKQTEKPVLFVNDNKELLWSNHPEVAKKAIIPLALKPTLGKLGVIELDGEHYSYEVLSDNVSDFRIIVLENENIAKKLISNPELSAEIKSKINNFVENLQGVLGINTLLSDLLQKAELFDETKYLNKSTDKIFKILNSLMNISELVKYSDDYNNNHITHLSLLNVSMLLKDMFEKIDRIILGQNFSFVTDFFPNLYAHINQDRFIGCIISLLLYSIKNSNDYSEIQVSLAEYNEEHLAFSVKFTQSMLSATQKEPLVGSEKQIIDMYADYYNCTFNEISMGEVKKLELIIPINGKNAEDIELKNVNFSPFDDKFSKLHIAFSQFTEYKIF